MAAVLALLSSVLWGSADFLGGTISRRHQAALVVGTSQAAGLLAIAVVAVAAGALGDDPGYLPWAVLSGVAGVVGLVSFYAALAAGTMGVVAPIAAAGAALPVLAGLVSGERPGPVALSGAVTALAGVVAAAGPELGRDALGGRRRAVGLAVIAALLFGIEISSLAHGSADSVTTTLVGMRLSALACTALALTPTRRPGRHRLPDPRPSGRDLPGLLALGALDVGATLAYALAARAGLVSLVAVLASCYPAVTVLLAHRLHGERLRPVQIGGIAAVLVGAALIALPHAG
jgi:drug/metabolite transporter (DMT)-like permease